LLLPLRSARALQHSQSPARWHLMMAMMIMPRMNIREGYLIQDMDCGDYESNSHSGERGKVVIDTGDGACHVHQHHSACT
jgi:hypothetical protein